MIRLALHRGGRSARSVLAAPASAFQCPKLVKQLQDATGKRYDADGGRRQARRGPGAGAAHRRQPRRVRAGGQGRAGQAGHQVLGVGIASGRPAGRRPPGVRVSAGASELRRACAARRASSGDSYAIHSLVQLLATTSSRAGSRISQRHRHGSDMRSTATVSRAPGAASLRCPSFGKVPRSDLQGMCRSSCSTPDRAKIAPTSAADRQSREANFWKLPWKSDSG